MFKRIVAVIDRVLGIPAVQAPTEKAFRWHPKRSLMYEYADYRPFLLTEEGLREVARMRTAVAALLRAAPTFRLDQVRRTCVDTWIDLAAVDMLVELGELRELKGRGAGLHAVYASTRPAVVERAHEVATISS